MTQRKHRVDGLDRPQVAIERHVRTSREVQEGSMKKKRQSVPLTLLGAASAIALGANDVPAQTGTKAGVAAAVRGPVQQVSFRTPSANVGRNVSGGDEIFLGDRIVTGPAGGLQIMLLDGTTFSVGPNSSLVIDEFVYNPADG